MRRGPAARGRAARSAGGHQLPCPARGGPGRGAAPRRGGDSLRRARAAVSPRGHRGNARAASGGGNGGRRPRGVRAPARRLAPEFAGRLRGEPPRAGPPGGAGPRGGRGGARLTGAGFGGSIVALCRVARAPEVMAALRERFYAPRSAAADVGRHLFTAEPSAGAEVL